MCRYCILLLQVDPGVSEIRYRTDCRAHSEPLAQTTCIVGWKIPPNGHGECDRPGWDTDSW
jgi:hypothetical protein